MKKVMIYLTRIQASLKVSLWARWLGWGWLFGYILFAPAPMLAAGPLVTLELRYIMPDAGKVTLVWGINGWSPVSEEIYPAGTVIEDGVMRTPMVQEGDAFVVKLQVPANVSVDYGFSVVESREGEALGLWEPAIRPIRAIQDEVIEIESKMALAGNEVVVRVDLDNLAEQEIRYFGAKNITGVTLVWSAVGWMLLPEAIWPAGTEVKDGLMYTPMTRQGQYFTVTLQLPLHQKINYSFLINQSGEPAATWDDNNGQEYSTTAVLGEVAEIRSSLSSTETWQQLHTVSFYLGSGLIMIGLLGLVLYLIPLRNPAISGLVITGLTLTGLALRLWLVRETLQQPLNLSGTELLYEGWAKAISQGRWPDLWPLYPFFLAICHRFLGHNYGAVFYLQAGLGALLVPLTFWLAHRFTTVRLSLLAAGLVSLHPALASQATRLTEETLYTGLLLIIALSLLRLVEAPQISSAIVTGALLGLSLFFRPALLFFPLFLLFFLPRLWSWEERLGISAICATAMLALILPWGFFQATFLPLSLDGVALWQGSPEFYHLMEEQQSPAQIQQTYLDPARNGGYEPLTIEGNRYFANRALNSMVAEPGIYGAYSFLKLIFFWLGHPTFDWPDYNIFNVETMLVYYSAPRVALILAARLLPLVALLALITVHLVHNQSRSLAPLLLICSYFMVIHVVTHAGLFASEPLHPLLVTIIVTAIKPAQAYTAWPATSSSRQWRYT